MSSKQNIHVIDDDPAILASITDFLMANGYDVDTYDSVYGFLETVGPHTTGCVVTDVRMPGIGGLELVSRMKERRLALPIIIITAYADVALAIEALKRGAVDLLEKPFNNAALVKAIREALANWNNGTGGGPKDELHRARLATLTAREKEVLARLLDGMPNKLIAYELGVSTRTIETHRATVMSKMNAGSLAELVRISLTAPPVD
jgi:two-component system, LuxR family, response regulator FixJ